MSCCPCERQSDLVTEEVAEEVCGEVSSEMMLLDHLCSCEILLPPASLCEHPKTQVITLISMCHLTRSYDGACAIGPAVDAGF